MRIRKDQKPKDISKILLPKDEMILLQMPRFKDLSPHKKPELQLNGDDASSSGDSDSDSDNSLLPKNLTHGKKRKRPAEINVARMADSGLASDGGQGSDVWSTVRAARGR